MPLPKSKMSNGKIKKGSKVSNSLPLNNPLSGVFDFGGLGNTAAASQPFEMSNSASYNLLSLQRIMLSYVYVIHGTVRTLVDQPVYDAFRGGVKVKSDEVSPEELDDLHRELKRLKFKKTITEALRWDRLYGGSAIIINTNQDYKTKLKVENVSENSKLSLIVADRWECPITTPAKPELGFDYYGKHIDASRVIKVVGEMPPSIVAQRLQGWGMSVIECVIRELNQYFKNGNVIFELMDEAKVDVWKIQGFNAQVLSKLAQGKTAQRIQMATWMKNYLNAITLDKEDDYEQKQVTFTGLAEMLEQIRIGMAAAIRMPMAKIFGLAAKGFASGEDDIENYNAGVENEREKAEDIMDVLVPIVCMKVWGFVPDDLCFEWEPLRVLSAEQEENVKTAKFARLSTLYSQGILNPQEYCEALKQDKILLLETEVAKGAEPQPIMAGGEEGEGEEIGGAKKPSAGKKEKE